VSAAERAPAARGRRPARGPAARPAAGRAGAARSGEHAPGQRASRPVVVVLVTVSDTRRGSADASGALAERLLLGAGAEVVGRAWVRDDATAIRAAARRALSRRDADALILIGGTGVAPRDVTPDAVRPLLERELPGFGERFRALSWASVGPAAWMSRAGAGVARGRLVVYLPGSPGAVREALEQLVLPELVHVVRLLGRL
jgi:molybdenum cofactor biosynthesis protein B